MQLDWLHQQPSWLLVLGLVLLMAAASEIGYRTGQRRHEATGDTGRGHFTAVQASLLALLALLLSFTINMASQRFDTRRQLVIDDANILTALSLRSAFLPEKSRQQFNRLLREYVALRADAAALKHRPTIEEINRRLAQSDALHRQMFGLVREEIQGGHPAPGTELMAQQLTEALAIQNRRIFAFRSRVPDTLLALLFATAVLGAAVVGHSGGLGKQRGVPQSVLLILFLAGTLYVLLDLDQPRSGLMQVDQQPLLQLREQLDRNAQQTP